MDLFQQLMTAGDYTPQDMFKAVTYIGTGTERSITGVGFKPDFVWIKCRSNALEHMLYDNLRGVGNAIRSNRSSPTWSVPTTLTSFDDDGFTIGAYGETNTAGYTYVAWCFKADNDAGTSNTNGSITSTVNAGKNFSIVKYTGTGANATIGHGLPVAPKIIIYRDLTAVNQWVVYSETIGNTKNLHLNLTNAEAVNAGMFNNTSPTTELFSVGTEAGVNTLNNEYIAYCFADLEGVSKVGSYIGDGSFYHEVSCGFQPAYLLIKWANGGTNWMIWDNKRDTHNPNGAYLMADVANAEALGMYIDFTATGFILKDNSTRINTNNGEYIFLAFAELPTADSPENHNLPLFGQIAYTGNQLNRDITGYLFKPDMVWGKSRSDTDNHMIYDTLRGSGNFLSSNLTAAESFNNNTLKGFLANGFSLGTSTISNGNNEKNIAWAWNAGGEAAPNTDGTIESTVMANVEGGFSIVRYNTGGTSSVDVGHGLEVAPDIVIGKYLDGTESWVVWHKSFAAGTAIKLSSNDAVAAHATMDPIPSSTVFTTGNNGFLGGIDGDYTAYCWTSKAGISDIGSYIGNGSTTGPVINCGFKPDWIMVKKTDSVGWWPIYDRRRDGDDTLTHEIHANSSNAESNTANGVQVTNIGFNPIGFGGDVNALNGNYIYMAFKAGDNPDTLHQTETGDLQISSESGSIVDDNGTHTPLTVGSAVVVGTTDPACGTYDMVFDATTNSYVSVPDSDDFDFGTGDFTIDFWFEPSSLPAKMDIVGQYTGATSIWYIYFNGTQFILSSNNAGTVCNIGASRSGLAIGNNRHWAVVRESGVIFMYNNGIKLTLISNTLPSGDFPNVAAPLDIGMLDADGIKDGPINGKLDQVRITKGTALWTTTNFNLTDKGLFYPSGTLNI